MANLSLLLKRSFTASVLFSSRAGLDVPANVVVHGLGRVIGRDLKRIVKYVAPGVGAGAKLMHDHFLTGDRQGAPGTVDQQTRTSAATA